MEKLKFDPACASLFTGVKAIYRAWQRGRLDWLADYFPNLKELDAACTAFDEHYNYRKLSHDEQVRRFINFLPGPVAIEVLSTALAWNTAYTLQYPVEFAAHRARLNNG